MSTKRKVNFLYIPLLVLGLLISLTWRDAIADEENRPVPSFSIPSLFQPGKKLTNQQLKGHATLLTVWGSWCGACRAEHKTLVSIQNRYHIPMYSIIYKDNSQDARAYLQRAGNPFIATGIDARGSVGNALGIYGTPQTFVIDKKGIIRYQYVGAITSSVWQDEILPVVRKYS